MWIRNVIAAAVQGASKKAGHKPSMFGDYRQLLERKDIDAVVLSVPDHWHALMTVDACRAGKDVYCEKPLTLFVTEGRKMVEVARETGRIVQTGSQQRSDDRFRLACELARNGKLGKLHTLVVGLPKPNYPPLEKQCPTAIRRAISTTTCGSAPPRSGRTTTTACTTTSASSGTTAAGR